ncbi:MAG: DUF4446 family protein [Lachnospiraceae bacterium]|nr:DUF4446 family protein [Lachnospiraceae bacterium]
MIEQYIGIDSDYILIGLAAVAIILLILLIVALSKIGNLNKKYELFMKGKDGASLEDTLINRINQVEDLNTRTEEIERQLAILNIKMKHSVQKVGILKYDALDEMGGKLSYALALLDERNNGCIINNVHSRTGSYNYIKEIIDGNSVVALSPEEDEALNIALSQEV